MIQFLKELFAETSTVSCVRFLSTSCVYFGFAITAYCIYLGKSPTETAILAGAFLGPGLGAKVWQKKYETKPGDTPEDKN